MSGSRLLKKHRELLAEKGIDPAWAEQVGVFSAQKPGDLPPDLATYASVLPGIVYPLRKCGGTIVHQLRPDNPPLDDKGKPKFKYLQAQGSGSVINVAEEQEAKMGKATHILLVEGTKQTLVAREYADESVFVVGIQGCQNWRHDKMPHEDLTTILSDHIEKATIILDADISTNHNVWMAGKALRDAIVGMTRVGSANVRFVNLSFLGGTNGLDDFIGRIRGDEERASKLATMIDGAKGLPGEPKKPVTMRSAQAEKWTSDMAKGVIYSQRIIIDADGHEQLGEETVQVRAAARIVKVDSWVKNGIDDLTGPKLLTLEVTTPDGAGGVVRHAPIMVPDDKLAEAGVWLGQLPGAEGVKVERPCRPNDDIANAIRAASPDDLPVCENLRRFGWYLTGGDEPHWVWVCPSGAHGAQFTDRVQTKPMTADFKKIMIPEMGDMVGVARVQMREFIHLRDLLNQPEQWDTMIGAFALSFLPITPQTAIGFFGPKSSGKSTLAQALTSCLSPTWGPRRPPMATFNSTANAVDLLCNGMNDIFVHVDDFKPENSARKAEEVASALDMLLRRSHGSGGKKRGEVDRVTGTIGVRDSDDAAPLTIITGEEVPTGGNFAESGLDRMMVIPVKAGAMFKRATMPDGSDDGGEAALKKFYDMTDEGFTYMTALFLRRVAMSIESVKLSDVERNPRQAAQARFDIFVRRLENIRTDVEKDLRDTYGERFKQVNMTSRAITSLASIITGYNVFMELAVDLEIVSEKQADELTDYAADALAKFAIRNTRTIMDSNMSDGQKIIERVQSLIAQGVATLGDPTSAAQRRVGHIGKWKGVEWLFLDQNAIATMLRWSGGARGVNGALMDLFPVGVTPPPNGKVVRTMDGVQVRCTPVSLNVWGGSE